MSLYPIMLELRGKLAVVVGGGAVAARKAAGLVDAGARTLAVSPEFHGSFVDGVERVLDVYRPQYLKGAALVFAATNLAAVNDAVVRDARAMRALVNRADGGAEADSEAAGDFVTPAKFVTGPVVVTVSAGSAALSVHLRNRLQQDWDDRWTRLAEAMRTLRPEILGAKGLPDQKAREAVFRALADEEALDVLSAGGIDALRKYVRGRVSGFDAA